MADECLRLLVIDDIKSVVDGLVSQIPWEDHGIEIVGACQNGEEGLAVARSASPDIILTDIRMPKLDGLELTKEVIEILPQCKVVFMSGYNDFEYAQRAVQLGAFDFVTKPFSREDILEVILKAKVSVEEEKRQLAEMRKMQQRVKESMPLLRQEYLTLLVRSSSEEERVRERWDFLNIALDLQNLAVMLVTIDGFTEHSKRLSVREMELIRFSIQNILEESVRRYTKGVVFREAWDRYVVIYNVSLTHPITAIAEACRKNTMHFTNYTLSVGIGAPVERVDELPSSYKQADTALAYHFYTGGNGVVSYEDISQAEQQIPEYPAEQAKEITFALHTGNTEKTMEILDAIRKGLTRFEPFPNPRYLALLLCGFANMMVRIVAEKLPYDHLETLEETLRKMQAINYSLEELYAYLKQIGVESCALIQEHSATHAHLIIEKAIAYIEHNLSEDLSVDNCAKHVHLSGSYFSNLFKKVTGESLNKFVTRKRIEKAREMLLQSKPIHEIASAVGYEERRYFSDVFKKITGLTPSEFRQNSFQHNTET